MAVISLLEPSFGLTQTGTYDLGYGDLAVVIADTSRHPAKELERLDMAVPEGLGAFALKTIPPWDYPDRLGLPALWP